MLGVWHAWARETPRGCFSSLYGCSEQTRFSGLFLRKLALDPLMTFGRLDLTVLLELGMVDSIVGDDHTMTVKCSTRDPLDGFLILIFSFLLATISCDFLSKMCNKNNDKEICK